MKVLVTGSGGFIGKNLCLQLNSLGINVATFTRKNALSDLSDALIDVDIIFHLAGENRPKNPEDYELVNVGLTEHLCKTIQKKSKNIPIVFASSIQAEGTTCYGISKRKAEQVLTAYSKRSGCPVYIYRLPNVFGKWGRPNYNSVVATFCHNIVNDHPIHIDNVNTVLELVYIDDVVEQFLKHLNFNEYLGENKKSVEPVYSIKLGELADLIYRFKGSRTSLNTELVGLGLVRALYSTYLSYIPPESFSYEVKRYNDDRGDFVEILKTPNSGQFSYFTARPGVTRGGHYHHTKTEKFLVVKGRAKFRFCNILDGHTYELETEGGVPVVVDTIPGWAHDITNTGDEDLLVLLWANERFDRDKPDTFSYSLG
jgi:UDP-2-acetamido-2,6-beta-L-arabino-hexul-4-ose reductase